MAELVDFLVRAAFGDALPTIKRKYDLFKKRATAGRSVYVGKICDLTGGRQFLL
jgi:hypothetical protein